MIETKTARVFFYFLLGFFLLLNLLTLPQYGMTWDEAAQHHVGKVALSYATGQSDKIEFLRDDLKYYGPFFEAANQYFGRAFLESFSLGYVDAFHILIVLTAALGLLLFFKLTSRLFGERIALWAAAFLMLYPRFVAHAHYNSKDIPLAAGFIITLYCLYLAFFDHKRKYAIFAGIIFGLTLAVRLDAVLVLPVFFGAYLLRPDRFYNWKRDFRLLGIFIPISALSVFAVWPSLWRTPRLFFEAITFFLNHGWQGSVLYFGKVYAAAALPWHYAPVYLAMATPLLLLVLMIFGVVFFVRQIRNKERSFAYLLIFIWIGFRLGMAVLPGAVRYDGVRHFIFILPAMMILAAVGLEWFIESIPRMKLAAIAIVFVWLLVEFFWIFPFGDSYFNEPTRLALAPHLEDKFEIEYWGSTYRQGAAWLAANAKPNSIICVPLGDHLLQFYPMREDLSLGCVPNSDYLMFITRWTYLPTETEELFHYREQTPVFTISRYGSDLLRVYYLTPPPSAL